MIDSGNPFQRNAAWLADRAGCLTASRFADALDFRKDGSPGAKRIALAKSILAERLTGDTVRTYVTDAMQHGIETEAEARAAYEAETGMIVTLTGFVRHPTIEHAGASPDGLIDVDGLVETKCPTTAKHVDWLLAGGVPDEHKPQMTFQLACTQRAWCDFVSYDPRVKDDRSRLIIRRFTPSTTEIAAAETAAAEFLAWVEDLWEQLTTRAA